MYQYLIFSDIFQVDVTVTVFEPVAVSGDVTPFWLEQSNTIIGSAKKYLNFKFRFSLI